MGAPAWIVVTFAVLAFGRVLVVPYRRRRLMAALAGRRAGGQAAADLAFIDAFVGAVTDSSLLAFER